jgi:hypothetical protein
MMALRHYIHLYFFRNTTYFGVVSGVFLVLDAGFVLKFYILVFPVFIVSVADIVIPSFPSLEHLNFIAMYPSVGVPN